jgi:hypothetical protein
MRVLRPAGGRQASQLSTAVLLLGLSAVLAMPLDVVWCRGSSGHSALELAWSACCAPADGGESCATWSVPAEPAAAGAPLMAGKVGCADLWLGGPVAVSPSPTTTHHGFHAIAASGAVASIASRPVHPRGARASTPQLRQLRELITTTVLTI